MPVEIDTLEEAEKLVDRELAIEAARRWFDECQQALTNGTHLGSRKPR